MFVFGIDIPLMELLVIYATFIGTAMLILIYQVYRLNKLLLTEEKEIKEFEVGLKELGEEEEKLVVEERKLAKEEKEEEKIVEELKEEEEMLREEEKEEEKIIRLLKKKGMAAKGKPVLERARKLILKKKAGGRIKKTPEMEEKAVKTERRKLSGDALAKGIKEFFGVHKEKAKKRARKRKKAKAVRKKLKKVGGERLAKELKSVLRGLSSE